MRNLLRTTAVAMLAVCFVSGTPRTVAADTALGTSKWSLEIGSNLGSGSSDVTFAIRRHSGASSAFRFGIDLGVVESDGSGTMTETGTADLNAEQVFEGYSYALLVQWMRFAPIRDNVTATFALGPVVQILDQSSRQGRGAGTPSFSEFENWQSLTTFGLDLGLGVEWFFNPRVSLGGQAGLRATMGTRNQVSIDRSGSGGTSFKRETEIDSDVAEITTRVGTIQLTGYF